MDRFEKGFSSPNHLPKSSASPKGPKSSTSGETQENDLVGNELGSNSKSQNPKKPVTKLFMSPTISASSKVTVPIKKILAEKNESLTTSSDNHHVQKSPILESRSGVLQSGRALSHCNITSDTDDDNELDTCSADSSLRPFDPLTNYLSPRLKYLRYKLNKRREILRRSVMMVNGEDNDNGCQDSDDGETEEEESEEFEVAEKRSLKGLLKFLLLLIFLGLSTSYILSMNSPRTSPVVEAIGGMRDVHDRIQKCEFEAVSTNEYSGAWKNGFGVQTGDGQACLFEANNQYDDHEFGRLQIDLDDDDDDDEVEGLEEITDEMVEMPEPPYGPFEDIFYDDERDERFDWTDWEIADIFDWTDWKIADIDDVDNEVKEVEEDSDQFHGWERDEHFDWTDWEIGDIDFIYDEVKEVEEDSDQFRGWERDEHFDWTDWEIGDIDDIYDEVKEVEEDSDQFRGWESAQTDGNDQELKMLEEGSEGLQLSASLERSDYFRQSKTPLGYERMDDNESAFEKKPANPFYQGEDLENDHKIDKFEGSFGNKEEMTGTRPGWAQDTTSIEDKTYNKAEEMDEISAEKAGEDTVKTKLNVSETNAGSMEDENFDNTELDTSRSRIEVNSTKVIKNVDLGPIPIVAIWFYISSIIFASLVYFDAPSSKATQAPRHDSRLKVSKRKEKPIQVQPNVEVVHMHEKAKSVAKHSSVFCSLEEARKDPARAPDVMLGESLRSCGQKGRMIEIEKSISPISHLESQAPPVAQAQTLNVLNTDSPSYGSFTAEKIICRKEGSKNGDVKLVTTPVRRSSRIHNRSITSP
ncbi:hypothetical protein ACH5RR_024447 [Cinchona calisaya]|uniref:Uncharacterized protein n=1 Tax=Cinchona calisaya TaxID=153742 RepID=A0ABD2YWP1_9GENT